MADSDITLRLKTSCATAHSHYDQIVAVSQKIINDSFDGLYERFPDYGKVDFHSRKIGDIKGNLLSPRLLLGGGLGSDLSITSALYVMRFKDGTLTIPADDDDQPDFKEDLTDWSLAVTIDLKTQSVTVDPNADPDEKARQQALWDFMHDKFDIPGDYSIERLFAKLADAHWKDFDFNNSQFGHNADGSKRSWGQLLKTYPFLETDLQIMLSHWALEEERKGLTTTGIKFTLPPPEKIDPLKPTFQPTAMMHQVYGYKNAAKGVPKPVVSYDVPGNLNSLLYCEMVSNHELPDDKQVASTGNFTAQAPSTDGSRIDGTFTLSHQLFLGTFLLPMLQAFNKTSIIYPMPASFSFSGGTSTIHWSYAIGNDQVHPDEKDAFFAFQPVYDHDTPNDATAYQFKTSFAAGLSPHGHNTDNGVYGSFDATGTSQVDFTWTPGQKGFTLKGFSVYQYDSYWADNNDMQRPFGWLNDRYEATWSMNINIDSVEGGVLKMSVDAGVNSNCNADVVLKNHKQQQSETPAGQTEGIRNEIIRQITDHVQTLESNLAKAFQTSAKFVYPGNGTFNFSAPCIGNTGEILATVDYIPAADKIKIPTPAAPKMSDMTHFPFSSVEVSIPGVAPTPKLDWSYNKPLKASQKAIEVLITGTNNGTEAVSLEELAFTLSSEAKGRGLVTGSAFKQGHWTIGKPDDKTLNVFQIVIGSQASTSAFATVKVEAGKKSGDGTTPLTFTGTGQATVEPKDSITLALYTGTGVPNTYSISAVETWPHVKGSASQNLPETISVILSP